MVSGLVDIIKVYEVSPGILAHNSNCISLLICRHLNHQSLILLNSFSLRTLNVAASNRAYGILNSLVEWYSLKILKLAGYFVPSALLVIVISRFPEMAVFPLLSLNAPFEVANLKAFWNNMLKCL